MTCDECEKAQEEGMVAYYRVHVANVGIIGCRKHVKAMIDTLNNNSDELSARARGPLNNEKNQDD